MLSRRSAMSALLAILSAVLVCSPGVAVADVVRGSQRQVMRTLDLADAWRITRGRGVLVAVLDSGVDPRHHDLAGSVITGRDFAAGANPPGVPPLRLHGTYMASLIAGHGHGPGHGDGVVGVAPEARVLSVRVILDDEEPGFEAFNSEARFEGILARGIRYAVDRGADVINMSISKDALTRADRAAIRYAVSKGVVLVAAAGNDGEGKRTAPYSYPASIPGVISVAAAGPGLRRASFSNRNSLVTVAAPGVNVAGAGPDDEYWIGKGTSQATALVSGVAALIKSRHPQMNGALVAQALTSSATARPAGGYDTGTGFGVVNAARALRQAAVLGRHRRVATGAGVQEPRMALVPGDGLAAVPAAEPIRVVRRDTKAITVYGAVALAGLLGAGTCLMMITMLARRTRREAEQKPQHAAEPYSAHLPT